MTTGYEERKRQEYKKQIEDAYRAYERREPLSLDKLLVKVQEFAYRKMYGIELDNPKLGTVRTADDYAQDVMVDVWQQLKQGSFRGDSSTFYAWINKICHNTKQNFLSEIVDQRKNKRSLMVPIFDEHGSKDDEEDNPEIYESDVRDFDIRIPTSVQGIDLTICKLLLTEVQDERNGEYVMRGRTYAEVGHVLQMTEAAVKKRLNRLQKRLKAEKDPELKEQQKIREDALEEQRDSVSRGLAKLRGTKS